MDSTFSKLFGGLEPEMTKEKVVAEMPKEKVAEPVVKTVKDNGSTSPRAVKDYQKSNIFFVDEKTEVDSGSPIPIIGRGQAKVIIGDAHDSASSSGNSSGCVTPSLSGSVTPNGSVNGDAEPRTSKCLSLSRTI
jgi:hypothetical protein